MNVPADTKQAVFAVYQICKYLNGACEMKMCVFVSLVVRDL